ncbi:facilitated trehalose transporter Tret1-like [Bradysia coprophila]|uniref:facilitated trehalose transporter Tret1-like n=1 Tax=Bradysia coprophila TaxID=38358 RepID=UPI00187D6F35|nr:facilitated trehalose transporter Tret1-like [Bradysia coprophila]
MCILTGFFASFIGRKTAMLLLVIPFTFGWTLIIFARNFTMVIMGRALLGIATGGVCVIVPIYIAEIAETRIRGVLCYLFQLSSSVGTLLAGASITTSRLSVVCAVIPLVFGILILFCPESPTYLMQNNRPGDASRALLRLLQPAQYKEAFQSLFRQSSVKALFISYGLFVCQQMCGINILKFYTEDIFPAVDETKLNSASLTAFIGVVATVVAGFIVDRIGRRALLITSQIIITICSLSLGFYFRIKESNSNSVDHLNWIPLIIQGVFTVAFSIGLGPIPWVILGEIFPTDVKCLAGSISTSASLTLAFITTKTHDSLHEVFGAGGVFWLYTSFSLLGTVFVYYVVPETKGKSLNNIQQIINEVQPADSDGLLENSDNIAMKELRDGQKGKFFTL